MFVKFLQLMQNSVNTSLLAATYNFWRTFLTVCLRKSIPKYLYAISNSRTQTRTSLEV